MKLSIFTKILYKTLVTISVIFVLPGCKEKRSINETVVDNQSITPEQEMPRNTIRTRYKVPEGWRRVESKVGSFEDYLQNLPLKPEGYVTHLYNGDEKANKVATSVIDMDIDSVDLQQCADAIIRLRAEYLYSKGLYDQIHFNFTNGFRCDYSKWAEGYRIKITGNNTSWEKTSDKDYSYKTFRKYLLTVFTYAGTISLYNELEPVKTTRDSTNFGVGTIIINPGSPGHAVIVVDMIENIKYPNKKAILLAQSYMPAQEIEILKGNGDEVGFLDEDSRKYWSTGHIGEPQIYYQNGLLCTPEYIFIKKKLMKFKDVE